ncbi:hypothetical protein [Acidovorax sacchari]|uniref:hypothetical protein n=1 Tax=Acidovorax sacchari TaxID=3230736 RepID=UPI0039E5B875
MDPNELPAQNPPSSLAVRVAGVAVGTLKQSWKAYVGVAAVAAGYGAWRQSAGTMQQQAQPYPVVDLPTVLQARQEVLQKHGAYIPSSSACHAIEPRVTLDLPPGYRGLTQRRAGKSAEVRIREGLPRDVGLHTSRHEYLHCFSHPELHKALAGSPHSHSVEEALTEFYADQFDGHPDTQTFADLALANGKTGVAAAAEIERMIGKNTLQRAFFKGDAKAIEKLSDALVKVWPRQVSVMAWLGIIRVEQQARKRQALAECFLGASLLFSKRFPDEGELLAAPSRFLPVDSFSSISHTQAEVLRQQAEAARAKYGEAFDQAFCNFVGSRQRAAMDSIAEGLASAWKPVL